MAKGTVLGGSRAFLLDKFQNDVGMSKERADLASGFGAGACQGVFMGPILLARTRVNQSMAERAATGAAKQGLLGEMKFSMSILSADIKSKGIGTLAIGMPQMIAKRSLDWGSRFILIGALTRGAQNALSEDGGKTPAKLGFATSLACNFFGGVVSCAITMPIDRMMPIIQQAGGAEGGMLTFIKAKMATEGWSTLQRGFIARSMHTGYHTMFAVLIADKVYNALA
jgi:hypothetical protein